MGLCVICDGHKLVNNLGKVSREWQYKDVDYWKFCKKHIEELKNAENKPETTNP